MTVNDQILDQMQIKQVPLDRSLYCLHRVHLLALHRLATSDLHPRRSDRSGGLVDESSFVKRLRLHGGDAGEDREDLAMSVAGDGTVEQ